MRIDLERGLITREEDNEATIQTVAKITIEELQTIGEDEAIGTLLMEFIYKMTTIGENEGLMINKELVDMLTKDFNKEDALLVGFDITGEPKPQLVVLHTDGTMSMIERQEA